jgi:hypothetical protein
MENRKYQNRIRETFLSESSGNSRARDVEFESQKTTDNVAHSKQRERTPGVALSSKQSEAFIPWVLHVVDKAFSR